MTAFIRAASLPIVISAGIGIAATLMAAEPNQKPPRPDKTQLQGEKSDLRKGDRNKPTATKQDGTKPESTKPDGNKPDSNKPDAVKPDAIKPDGTKPEGVKPDGTKPDATKPEQTKPETKPEGTKPGSTKPEQTKPDQVKPEATKQDGTKPEGTKPDQTKPDGTRPERNRDEQTKPDKSSEDAVAREAKALEFAKANHPELAELLEQLHASNPKAFENAVNELIRAQERLARVQERTPDRYESELALWKLDSRIRLLAAQSAMGDSTEVRAELKGLLQERRTLKLAGLKAERERQQARVQKLDETIAEMEAAAGDEAVDRELEQLLSQARKRANEVKPRRTSPTSVRERKTDRTDDKKQKEDGTVDRKDSKEKE